MSLTVSLLEHSVRAKFANIVTDSHADELVDGPSKERDHEPSKPYPTADGESIPVSEIEDKEWHYVKKQRLSAGEGCR